MRAFEASQYFFDVAAEYLNIDGDLRETLLIRRSCQRARLND
jgi:hypothetical protein